MLEPDIVMEKAPHTYPALGRKKQLLVVDDDKAIQTLLARASVPRRGGPIPPFAGP